MRAHLSRLLVAAAIAAPSAVHVAAPAVSGPVVAARHAEPVVVAGAQMPGWSRLAAVAAPQPYPNGALLGGRDAHAGTVVVPPDARTGVPTGQITGYRWAGSAWQEIPVQVDERFPYLLSNRSSSFAIYSATDEELTYAWDVESWKKTDGVCSAQYPPGAGAMPDPAAGLDDDDEVVFMASDAGALAPAGAPAPSGTLAGTTRQQVTLADPLDGTVSYVYLFRTAAGSSFNSSNGYVRYQRDANADQWIDRQSFLDSDPEKLGSSNTGYGPNLKGKVCYTATASGPDTTTVRDSTDRFPRDGVTVTTDAYRWRATGRWMVREMHVAKPGQPGVYGPDLIDRWKGRAFQQSPDSSISIVGFEDEQVNWEANSALLGERAGAVRAIRETWGADSGTNVTKTETLYRDAVTYNYHLRVHPIPPDGIYTSWDYNAGVVARYYDVEKPDGVAIDGVNDDIGNIDAVPVTNSPAFFDLTDPTFNAPLGVYNWEEVSGANDNGSLVYLFEIKGAQSVTNPLVVPYYRDDKCLDDGTGDDPVVRPWPGERTTDARVKAGYSAASGGTPYAQLTCDQKQGAWASHGVHIFFTGDTDNAFQSKPATETNGQQWQFAVPTASPTNIGEPYAEVVRAPLRPIAVEVPN